MRGVADGQVLDLVERFRGTGHIVRFIEYMDVGTLNRWQGELVVPSVELIERIAGRWPLRLSSATTAARSRNATFEDGAGEIGFISSVSQPFCGDCSRASFGRRQDYLPVCARWS